MLIISRAFERFICKCAFTINLDLFLALDYKNTATYYWSLIAENGFVTESVTGFVDGKNNQTKEVETIAGPFGFDEAIKLGTEQVHSYRANFILFSLEIRVIYFLLDYYHQFQYLFF